MIDLIYDSIKLKNSLGFMDIDLNQIEFKKIDGKYYINKKDGINNSEIELSSSRNGYDKVIRCLGFKFDHTKIFNMYIYKLIKLHFLK